MKHKKKLHGFTYMYIKYSKFWSVSLEHFVECKPLISEEWPYWCCFWSSCCYFHGKEKGWKWMGLIPTSKDDFTEEILFFLLAQLASLSSASSSFYSTSFLFFSFFFSSFACHIFKEASPCQNCQLLLHKLCPSQIWQKIEKDSRFWNVMHQCTIRLNSWHIDRYRYISIWCLNVRFLFISSSLHYLYVHVKRTLKKFTSQFYGFNVLS